MSYCLVCKDEWDSCHGHNSCSCRSDDFVVEDKPDSSYTLKVGEKEPVHLNVEIESLKEDVESLEGKIYEIDNRIDCFDVTPENLKAVAESQQKIIETFGDDAKEVFDMIKDLHKTLEGNKKLMNSILRSIEIAGYNQKGK